MSRRTGSFERADRLLRRQEFRHVARYGRRARTRGFVVLALARPDEGRDRRVRLGITVGRQVGKAVVRNRLKRGIRLWFCQRRPEMQANLDVVVIAQRQAATLSSGEMTSALEEGARAAGVMA